MIEDSSKINYDYVNEKLLYLLLIRGCSVVVRPFEYGAKLDGLFELLRAFYIIEEIDMNEITNPAHLEGFFSQYDDTVKKSILLLRNVTQATINEVIKYPEILFIALEKDQSIDYSEFSQIAVFNKKTKKISQLIPKSLISPNSLAYKWIKENIISNLKSVGIFEIKEYLSSVEDKVGDLFQILPGITKKDYHEFCQDLTPLEQKAITAICEQYYNVKLPEYTKKTINGLERKEHDAEVDEKNSIIESKESENFTSQIAKEPISIKKIIENSQVQEKDQINEEIWSLLSNDNGFTAFSISLSEIIIPTQETFSTPEKKYYYLRANQWKSQIPFEFFKNLFRYFVGEEIKSDQVLRSDLYQYLRDKHTHLVDICSMFASPEFKRMDPTQYADDEILRFHLKKDSVISHILPVEKSTKSVLPKDLEKMFNQGSVTNGNENFHVQYQKNLDRLMKEYGEREITPDLIDKLRTDTKNLQHKISALFQD